MSSVLLLVGQCGNQIGHELMKVTDSSIHHPLGHRDGKLRCICVDSEAKVIGRNMQEDLRLSSRLYRDGNVVVGQRGRGNNWALGYHGLADETEETSILHRSMETLRKEVERCDSYAGTIVLHSLTGGTGSGLGSHLVETIRDTYPLAHVMSIAVSPHISGDSPLQHYNSLLSLATLQRCADGVILFSNDDVLHRLATHRAVVGKKHANISGTVSLGQMNSYIVSCVAGVLQPLGSKPKKEDSKKTTGKGNSVKDKSGRGVRYSSLRGNSLPQSAASLEDSGFGVTGFHSSLRDRERSLLHSRSTGFGRSLLTDFSSCDDSISVEMSTLSCSSARSSASLMAQQPRSSSSALRRYQDADYTSKSGRTASHESDNLTTAVSAGNEPWEMLRSVCPDPSKKFVTMHHCAKAKVSWEALTQSLIHSTQRYDKHGAQFSTLSSLLVARGDFDASFSDSADKIREKVKSAFGCVRWNPFPVDFWISKHNPAGPPGSQSLTLCQNSSKTVETLEEFTSKARVMYNAGAYLHWYWKHGCSQGDFAESFDTLDTVVEEYRSACVP